MPFLLQNNNNIKIVPYKKKNISHNIKKPILI